jgi:nickel/cobalt exporter
MRARRVVIGVLAALGALAVVASPASAHPLGNFTVNVYSGIRVLDDRVEIDLVVDMAEIPAFQEQRQIDSDGDGSLTGGETFGYSRAACADAVARLATTADDRPLPLRVGHSRVTFPPGMAGLATLRLSCAIAAYTGPTGQERTVRFANRLYDDRVGWREVTAIGDGVSLVSSNVPTRSPSAGLTAYPDDLLQSPLDQRSATLRVSPGGAGGAGPVADREPASRLSPLSNVADGITRSFLGLVGRGRLSPVVGLLALGLAAALGAIHSLAPGHGKTVMAAYLVGQRGSLRDGAMIGLTVTATHTAGVLVLGVAVSLTTTLAPEKLYPWLGLVSGLLIVAIGVLLMSRVRRRRPWSVVAAAPSPEPVLVGGADDRSGRAGEHWDADASGGHPLGHAHHHTRHHRQGHHHGPVAHGPDTSRRGLLAMGFAGGLVPSPSALVVLLSAIALGRAWFGVLLVLFYGFGMALTLVGAGLLLVRTRTALERRMSKRPSRRVSWLAATLPALTAFVLASAGAFLTVRAATQL